MSRVINAVFEDGVFKPLQKVDIKDHEKVTIKLMPLDEWQARFNRIIRRIHDKAAQYSSEEIEADITQALREVKEGKGEP
jgi:predicted DNA-binding antitoxin AbrB/MazE fold protein